jgi:hypothetical protein
MARTSTTWTATPTFLLRQYRDATEVGYYSAPEDQEAHERYQIGVRGGPSSRPALTPGTRIGAIGRAKHMRKNSRAKRPRE